MVQLSAPRTGYTPRVRPPVAVGDEVTEEPWSTVEVRSTPLLLYDLNESVPPPPPSSR